MWGTHVPSTIVDGEHVFGCCLGHSPLVMHCHRGTCPWYSLSNHNSGPHIQMVMPFIWGVGYRTSYPYQRAYSSKMKRGKFLVGLKRTTRRPLARIPIYSNSLGGSILRHITLLLTKRDPMTSLVSSGRCHMCWLSRLWDLQNTRALDWVERPLVCQWCIEVFAKESPIFHPMFPLELPKVMGLKGIHYPETLHCHVGLSYYPWCRKEGQNEGTIVNHLWTTHYKLGLVYSRCLCCPVITSEAIQHYGPSCECLSMEEEGRRPSNEDSSSSD